MIVSKHPNERLADMTLEKQRMREEKIEHTHTRKPEL